MKRPGTAGTAIARGTAGLCFALLAACVAKVPVSDPSHGASHAEAIRSTVAQYVRSVDNADTALAREVWADREDISFIHPLGHERGWLQIKTNLYEKIMRDMLSSRKLTVRDLAVKRYGDAAVVEFYWDFDAKWRKDGRALQSHGRETQVLRKGAGGKWEIVHVHYSGMPANSPGQGL